MGDGPETSPHAVISTRMAHTERMLNILSSDWNDCKIQTIRYYSDSYSQANRKNLDLHEESVTSAPEIDIT